MYRLQFVYSDGTDDFDYMDEIETFDQNFDTPKDLVLTFIKLAKTHPQIEHYKIMDPQCNEPMRSIYHFLMENFKDQECYDLADQIFNITRLDWEQYTKFFGPVIEAESEPQAVKEEKKPAKNANKKYTVDVSDVDVFGLDWIIEVLEYQVPNLILKNNDQVNHVKRFIQELRVVCSKKRDEEQDSKEYQEYLRLKEKFEGK